jgi:hypothetical protein
MKNDFLLIQEIKNGEFLEENYITLYKKYIPMINKHASYLFSKFKKYNSELKNDYKQDAYFAMLEAINSTNLDLVTYNKNDWLFVGRFWFYLKGLSKKYYKRIVRSPIDIELFEESSYVGYFQGYQDCYNEIYERVCLKVSDNHKKVLEYRLQGFSLKEIKDLMSKSYGWVHLKLYQISELVKKEFGVEYSF